MKNIIIYTAAKFVVLVAIGKALQHAAEGMVE